VLGHRILWGHGSDPVLFFLDEIGGKTDSISLDIPARPLEGTEIDRAKQERMSRPQNDPSLQRFWEQVFDEVEFPELLPFFDELLVDSNRLIWVRNPPIQTEDSVQWWGFEETGEPNRILTIPPGLRVLDFRDSTALVIETSDLDVERVLALRLIGEGQ
jgi:hypothetical protein